MPLQGIFSRPVDPNKSAGGIRFDFQNESESEQAKPRRKKTNPNNEQPSPASKKTNPNNEEPGNVALAVGSVVLCDYVVSVLVIYTDTRMFINVRLICAEI